MKENINDDNQYIYIHTIFQSLCFLKCVTSRRLCVSGWPRGLIRFSCGSKLIYRLLSSNTGPRSDVCHQGCTYTVLQTVQTHRVDSAVYDTLHYKEHLKSFDKSME